MPRVATDFAATIGYSSASFIADASNANETIRLALSTFDSVFIRPGTYNFSDTLSLESGKSIIGDPNNRPVLKLAAGVNKSVLTNAGAAAGDITRNVTIRNIVIDQQGALQTGGGGLVPIGIQNWLVEDVIFKKSYRFNFLCLHQSTGVPNLTGSATFTKESAVVTGSGTLFTTELAVGDILKSAGSQFGRVQSISSDTSLTLTIPWGYVTESAVSFKVIEPNSDCVFRRVRFEGTVAAEDANGGIDAAGFGLFDNGLIEYCEAMGTTDGGCGFVPDHTRGAELNYLVAHATGNSGISLETCEDVTILNSITYNNTDNGVQLISGTSRCTVQGSHSLGNTKDGFIVTYNTPNAGVPRNNTFTDCFGYLNTGYGFRNNGADNTEFDDVAGFDNDAGGLIINQINSRTPNATNVHDSVFYDDRGGAKSQDRGIYVVSSTNAVISNNTALDSLHTVAGIVDNGTNTTLSGNTTT